MMSPGLRVGEIAGRISSPLAAMALRPARNLGSVEPHRLDAASWLLVARFYGATVFLFGCGRMNLRASRFDTPELWVA
jgi:hypothetical protein